MFLHFLRSELFSRYLTLYSGKERPRAGKSFVGKAVECIPEKSKTFIQLILLKKFVGFPTNIILALDWNKAFSRSEVCWSEFYIIEKYYEKSNDAKRNPLLWEAEILSWKIFLVKFSATRKWKNISVWVENSGKAI